MHGRRRVCRRNHARCIDLDSSANARYLTIVNGRGSDVKISIDLNVCQGYANCVMEAEDIFDLDEETGLAVLVPDEVPEQRLAVLTWIVVDIGETSGVELELSSSPTRPHGGLSCPTLMPD